MEFCQNRKCILSFLLSIVIFSLPGGGSFFFLKIEHRSEHCVPGVQALQDIDLTIGREIAGFPEVSPGINACILISIADGKFKQRISGLKTFWLMLNQQSE